MKALSLILGALCLFLSCSTLPKVPPLDGPPASDLERRCSIPFPDGKWQFLHSLQATMPGGEKALMLGVTIISSGERTARCVIMTIEGLVVFDALYDGGIVINRGIPPFDSEDFARGLIEDIKLIFFRPEGPPVETGTLEGGLQVCRHQGGDGLTVDIVVGPDRGWELRRYGRDLLLTRTVRAFFGKGGKDPDHPGIPGRLELTAHGVQGYSLVLDLLEAVPLGR